MSKKLFEMSLMFLVIFVVLKIARVLLTKEGTHQMTFKLCNFHSVK